MTKIIYKRHRILANENTATYLSIFINDIPLIKSEYFTNVLSFIQTTKLDYTSVSQNLAEKLEETKKTQSVGLFLFTEKIKNIFPGTKLSKTIILKIE
ncbi:MAG TPA: hypothetical protein VIM29_01420 [Bacillota bacterium]